MSRHANNGGFTLIELTIAAFLTVIITMLVFMMYQTSIRTFRAAEQELRWLASFRSASDSMERELGSILVKSGYLPADPENASNSEPGALVTIDGRIFPRTKGGGGGITVDMANARHGLFGLRFRGDYIGFYTSMDGRKIDRVEYYYNKPEPRMLWDNGIDDDHDDPDCNAAGLPQAGRLALLLDDKGSFMVRRWADEIFTYSVNSDDHVDQGGTYEHAYDEWASWELPADVDDESPDNPYDNAAATILGYHPRETNTQDTKGYILADRIDGVRFRYLWIGRSGTGRVDPKIRYAPRWPYDSDLDPFNGDLTMLRRGGIAGQEVGLSYLTLPLAVEVEFMFRRENIVKKMTKTIYLYGSQWNKWMNDSETIDVTP